MLLSSTLDNVFQLIIVLFVFVFVLGLTYFFTKWLGSYQRNAYSNKNLQIMESVRITNNKFICLVRVGDDRYKLVGVGKDELVDLGDVDSGSLKEFTSSVDTGSFNEVLERFKKTDNNTEDNSNE